MKKIIGILICMMFIGTSFSIMPNITNIVKASGSTLYSDGGVPIVDQAQPIEGSSANGINANLSHAQSFKPSFSPLIKVELYMNLYKNEPGYVITEPIKVSIRKNLSGEDLSSISVPSNNISLQINRWIEFDFPDIDVQLGQTYYIVCTSNIPEYMGSYCWHLMYNDSFDYYNRGMMWYSNIGDAGKWSNLEWTRYVDFCFKTYSLREPPNPPTIQGPLSGKPDQIYTYKIVTLDPENDEMYYFIEWGDGTDSGWLGLYPSGKEISANQSWKEKGTYLIKGKAKDIYGAESDWSTLEVTMPKNKINYQFNILFERFFQRFPFFEKILKQYYN